jgi:hypothetical protein
MLKYYANGCSYTWGGELFNFFYPPDVWLPGQPDHPINKRRLATVYPHHLGKKINADIVVNEALGGGSNHRIVRLTLEYFNNCILRDEDLKEYFVTIQWTEPSRWTYFNLYENDWNNITVYNASPTYYPDISDHAKKLKIEYYKNYQSVLLDYHYFITHITALGNFFKANKIPYIFFKHTGWDTPFFEEKIIDTKDYRKILSQYNWLHDDPCDTHMNTLNCDTVKGSHLNEKGHIQFADILYREIVKKKLVKIKKDAI